MGNSTTLINFLIKLQNATKCKKFSYIETKPTIKIIKILNLLIDIGYIRFYTIQNNKTIKIIFKYNNDKPVFNKIKIISKPGEVHHFTNHLIKQQAINFAGVLVFSTSKGFLTHNDVIKKNLGGILLYKFYY